MINGQGDLKHYGILGMKWGVRKDRSSGRTRSADSRTAKNLRRKRIEEMSNEELKKLNTRLQLERTYKDLTKKNISAGQQFVSNVLKESGKNIASKYVTQAGTGAIDAAIKAIKGD